MKNQNEFILVQNLSKSEMQGLNGGSVLASWAAACAIGLVVGRFIYWVRH